MTNLIIKVTVAAHLIGLLNFLWLFVTLEPGDILFVKSPALIFQFFRRKIPNLSVNVNGGSYC